MTELETLIRQAEMAVVESDRRWQRSAHAVGPALQSTAQRAAGTAGVAVVAVAALWLVLRTTRRKTRRQAPPHFSTEHFSTEHFAAAHAATARAQPRRGILPRMGRHIGEFGGSLLRSALHPGAAPGRSSASLPVVLGLVVPWFTQWWRRRHSGR